MKLNHFNIVRDIAVGSPLLQRLLLLQYAVGGPIPGRYGRQARKQKAVGKTIRSAYGLLLTA
ncbi:hypothetical protein GCM10022394_12630 [Zobellella aerophila]|uniref:Uncharacterized protein n=1 Tax=Zobellella aerophila TaxID=870480 RepID=A0ABP6VGF2_9GAMM